MVKPLYPLSDIRPEQRKKKRDEEKARRAYILQLSKNPYIISVVAIVVVLLSVIVIHSSRSSRVLDASASPADGKGGGAFSFLRPSKYFSSKSSDIGVMQKEQLKKMGIDEKVESMGLKIEAKNLREERKMLAMRKYEAVRQTAERHVKEKEEQRQRLQSDSARQLKDAVLALEDSNTLGIIKLERLLDEKLSATGGDSKDLDVLIFAYDRLAKTYQSKNMESKAKEAYINAFKLMKSQASTEQEPDWDGAISNVEQMKVKPNR